MAILSGSTVDPDPRNPAAGPNHTQSNVKLTSCYLLVAPSDYAGVSAGKLCVLSVVRRSRAGNAPKIAVCDTQPCTLAPKVHGCVSQTAIMPERHHYDLAL